MLGKGDNESKFQKLLVAFSTDPIVRATIAANLLWHRERQAKLVDNATILKVLAPIWTKQRVSLAVPQNASYGMYKTSTLNPRGPVIAFSETNNNVFVSLHQNRPQVV